MESDSKLAQKKNVTVTEKSRYILEIKRETSSFTNEEVMNTMAFVLALKAERAPRS